MKLCIHCKHFESGVAWALGGIACTHPNNTTTSLVNGHKRYQSDPEYLRNRFDLCGQTGKWYEQLEAQEIKQP